MWKALREIVKGSTFYYKQLNLFLFLALIFSSVYVGTLYGKRYLPQLIQRGVDASDILKEKSAANGGPINVFDVSITNEAKVMVNGQVVRGAIQFGQQKDEFLFILAREPKEFIEKIQAVVHLPYDVKDASTVSPRIYAIHGVEQSDYRFLDKKTVLFRAQAIEQTAEISIGFSFAKDYFALQPADQLRSKVKVLSPIQWLAIGSVLPLITLLFLGFMIWRRAFAQWRVRNKMPINLPPSTVPPALIGALYHGHIGKKEITATLFDLARRGFIAVHLGKDDEIVFAKGASLYSTQANLLRPYEVFLLHQIFGDENFAARGRTVTADLNSELFSSKIALTILNIYDATVAEGYFIRSPNAYFQKYRSVGLFLFFAALIALVYQAFTLPEPAFVLFFWFGMMIAALIIIKITPGLPRRTKTGELALHQWMGFRNFLAAKQLIVTNNTNDFFQNLPHAIVMDCEKEWITRWKDQPIRLPDWFTAEDDMFTAEEFSKSVVAIIDFLAKHLIAARPPDLA